MRRILAGPIRGTRVCRRTTARDVSPGKHPGIRAELRAARAWRARAPRRLRRIRPLHIQLGADEGVNAVRVHNTSDRRDRVSCPRRRRVPCWQMLMGLCPRPEQAPAGCEHCVAARSVTSDPHVIEGRCRGHCGRRAASWRLIRGAGERRRSRPGSARCRAVAGLSAPGRNSRSLTVQPKCGTIPDRCRFRVAASTRARPSMAALRRAEDRRRSRRVQVIGRLTPIHIPVSGFILSLCRRRRHQRAARVSSRRDEVARITRHRLRACAIRHRDARRPHA